MLFVIQKFKESSEVFILYIYLNHNRVQNKTFTLYFSSTKNK